MTDADLAALAYKAGIEPRYRDAFGQEHDVTPDTLRSILQTLGPEAGLTNEASDSHSELALPPLVIADVGRTITLPVPPARFRIILEDGSFKEGMAGGDEYAELPPILPYGYHQLEIGNARTTLANAPQTCAPLGQRSWGLAAQLYSLRRTGDGGIGDFLILQHLIQNAARHGAAAVAISPVHAQFSADLSRFSPYAPSSRCALNVMYGDDSFIGENASEFLQPEALSDLERLDLVDWPAAGQLRLSRYRQLFDAAGGTCVEFEQWRRGAGKTLERHALFEALHQHFFSADNTRWHWRNWPAEYRDPDSADVTRFAQDNQREVSFHAFLQFLAARGIANAHRKARDAGMRVGLISDLAVGSDSGGSDSWARQGEMLIGLSIGAPPDLLNTQGQDWGLTAISPQGLRRSGYSAFLEMLRTALRHAGGVRIDHVMGLARLWVLPEGAKATEGAYIRFPLDDMLRLVALESRRHNAIVLGEDLGTLPEGFQNKLASKGIMGLRVLYFEREENAFRSPAQFTSEAAAMTSTHDLATVAGWWSGHDLDTRKALDLLGDETAIWHAYEDRHHDRQRLWHAFRASGAADGESPPPEATAPVVDAAIRHVAGSSSELMLLPIEDALGLAEQPNLPGTTAEHPNWRRRLPGDAETILSTPSVVRRLDDIAAKRP